LSPAQAKPLAAGRSCGDVWVSGLAGAAS